MPVKCIDNHNTPLKKNEIYKVDCVITKDYLLSNFLYYHSKNLLGIIIGGKFYYANRFKIVG